MGSLAAPHCLLFHFDIDTIEGSAGTEAIEGGVGGIRDVKKLLDMKLLVSDKPSTYKLNIVAMLTTQD